MVPGVVQTSTFVLEISHTIWSKFEPLVEAGSKVPLYLSPVSCAPTEFQRKSGLPAESVDTCTNCPNAVQFATQVSPLGKVNVLSLSEPVSEVLACVYIILTLEPIFVLVIVPVGATIKPIGCQYVGPKSMRSFALLQVPPKASPLGFVIVTVNVVSRICPVA